MKENTAAHKVILNINLSVLSGVYLCEAYNDFVSADSFGYSELGIFTLYQQIEKKMLEKKIIWTQLKIGIRSFALN